MCVCVCVCVCHPPVKAVDLYSRRNCFFQDGKWRFNQKSWVILGTDCPYPSFFHQRFPFYPHPHPLFPFCSDDLRLLLPSTFPSMFILQFPGLSSAVFLLDFTFSLFFVSLFVVRARPDTHFLLYANSSRVLADVIIRWKVEPCLLWDS